MARQSSPSWRKGKRNNNDSFNAEQATDEIPARRGPSEQGRYRLQVDRQTKGSYPTHEGPRWTQPSPSSAPIRSCT